MIKIFYVSILLLTTNIVRSNFEYITYNIKELDSKFKVLKIIEQDPANGIVSISEVPKKEFRTLAIKIKVDKSSPTGYYIPKSFEEAVKELDKMLCEKTKSLILSNDWNISEFTEREDMFFELALFLEEKWNLKSDNLISLQLQKNGVYNNVNYENDSIHWVLEALLKGVYDINHKEIDKLVDLLPYYGYLSIITTRILPSGSLPYEDVPKKCGGNKNEAKSIWLDIEGTNVYNNPRRLYYVKCSDKKIMGYFFDRGWFYTKGSILSKIEQESNQ